MVSLGRIQAAILLVGSTLMTAFACSLNTDAQPCSTADDCSAPYLCCTAGAALGVEGGGPRCKIPEPTLSFCDAWLPHLIEDNPCGRAPIDLAAEYPPAAADQCRAGLVCCPTTLTCLPEGDCSGAPPPPSDGVSSGDKCSSDDTCPSGEVCCGITYFNRDGQCLDTAACADTVPPTP